MVKISVVTIVYNGERHIRATIDSVLNQQYESFEFLIIDGDSTDNTRDIVLSYTDSRILYYSQKDSGIAEAFNRGLYLASGELVLFLNSDDKLFDKNVFENVAKYSTAHPDINLLYGRMYWMDVFGIKGELKQSRFAKLWITLPMSHGASFIRSSVAKKYRYDSKYHIAMDVDYLLKFIDSYILIPCDISLQREGGVSSRNRISGYFEYTRVLMKNGEPLAILGLVIKVGFYVFKKVSGRLPFLHN